MAVDLQSPEDQQAMMVGLAMHEFGKDAIQKVGELSFMSKCILSVLRCWALTRSCDDQW